MGVIAGVNSVWWPSLAIHACVSAIVLDVQRAGGQLPKLQCQIS